MVSGCWFDGFFGNLGYNLAGHTSKKAFNIYMTIECDNCSIRYKDSKEKCPNCGSDNYQFEDKGNWSIKPENHNR